MSTEQRIAVLAMAYGTPASADQILPYYTDIRRGWPPSPEQLAALTARYAAIGGVSPLAARSTAQCDALQLALDSAAPGRYLVSLGTKHGTPRIEDSVATLAVAGFRRIIGVVLAPHYSAYSVGQYLDRLAGAGAEHGITVDGIRSWATEPAFIEFIAADLAARLAVMPPNTKVVFTAHSLPERILATGDPYAAELRSTAEAVAAAVGLGRWSQWSVAWQSAGRTSEQWIGPDILQVIDELSVSENADGVLVSAVGFVADHLEVLYDLDIEANARAEKAGLRFDRTACVNDDPGVMAALAARVTALG